MFVRPLLPPSFCWGGWRRAGKDSMWRLPYNAGTFQVGVEVLKGERGVPLGGESSIRRTACETGVWNANAGTFNTGERRVAG